MRRFFVPVSLAALALGLSACATLVEPADPVDPLALAFTEPVASLEARAARGENEAEYALAFLSRVGLRGVPQDPGRAARLRDAAMTPTTLMITQYIPAVGGGAGQTHLIPVNRPGMTRDQMVLLDVCGLAVLLGAETTGREVCTPAGWERLVPLALQVAAESAASTPLP